MKTYLPFHIHSEYSLLDSTTSYSDYINAAVEMGLPALGSSEHGLDYQWTDKKLACERAGLKFIRGCEVYLTETHAEKVRDNYHTILIAKNEEGSKELNRLISISTRQDHKYYKPRISFDEFLGTSPNLIATSACLASPLNRLPKNNPYYERLVERYDYLEIQPHIAEEQRAYNQYLYELSRACGKPLVVGTDTHNLNAYKAECRKLLLLAKHIEYDLEDEFDLTFKSYSEIADMFSHQGVLPEYIYLSAIENTNLITDSVEDWKLDTSFKYPELYGERDKEVFISRIESKFTEKIERGILPESQIEQLREDVQEEIRVFDILNMSGFMLFMSELLCWAREERGIPVGPGRGSVSGSRVAYITDITDVNSVQWGTVFSRFASTHRLEIGDIDIDIAPDQRAHIYNYIIDRFGQDRTSYILALGTISDKGTIDEIVRALGIKQNKSNFDKKKNNPYTLDYGKQIKALYEYDPEGARNKYPEVFYYFDGMNGTIISESLHPAGMVAAPITLEDNYGIIEKDEKRVLMLDMGGVHNLGLVKYDILGLKGVAVIRDACISAGISYPRAHETNWDDQNVWKDMLRSPVGIFEFESPYAFECLRKMKPISLLEMSLVTAALRPSGASYRDRLLARIPNKNPSPFIDEMLADNLGYLVYQEDITKFLQEVAGFNGSDADEVRRGIGRKKKEVIDAALPQILEGYCRLSDKPRAEAGEEAKQFLQIIEDASSYSFNYSHSLAYCMVGYLCAWLRHYYPIEFITSYLNNANNEEDVTNGTALATLYGIRVSPPRFSISRATYSFDKNTKTIAKGLASIRYLGEKVAEELFALSQSRRYEHFVDLLADLKNTSLDSRQLDILIKIDFFSDFGNQRELLRIVEMWGFLKKGDAKQLKKSDISGSFLEEIVARYSNGVTKSGAEAKNYILLDPMNILREIEVVVKGAGLEDLDDATKVHNSMEFLGYVSESGREEDRRKLIVSNVRPVYRKKDGKQFGFSISTKSLGSGKEARFTVFNKIYEKSPINKGDIILCKAYERDGQYFQLTAYEKVG